MSHNNNVEIPEALVKVNINRCIFRKPRWIFHQISRLFSYGCVDEGSDPWYKINALLHS